MGLMGSRSDWCFLDKRLQQENRGLKDTVDLAGWRNRLKP